MRPIRSARLPLFYAVTMLYWFTIYTYVPLLSPYVRSIGGSLTMVGIVIGSYGLTQMLVRIPLGIWSDRVGRRKPFLMAGLAVGTLSSLGLAFTHTPALALLFRGLAGVAAASWVVFTVLYASYHKPDQAPHAMGVISFYTSIGQMIAATAGGIVAQHFGWQAAFLVGAAGGVAGFLLSAGIRDHAPADDSGGLHLSGLIQVGRDRILLGVSILAVFAQVITFTTMFGFTPQAAVHLGASKFDLSILALCSTLPNAIASRLSGGLLARWMGERRVIVLGFAVTAICTASIPLAHSLSLLYISQALNGFGQGLCLPVLMGLSIRHIQAEQRATAMGFFQAIYSLGIFGGPAIAGAIGDVTSLSTSFFVIAIVSVIAAALTVRLTPRRLTATVAQLDS